MSEADPWVDLRAHTAARLALGRSGSSLPTAEVLRFGLAHAQARDAVQRELDAAALATRLQAQGRQTLQVASAARDRKEFLLRPDQGRRLSADSRRVLDDLCGPAGTTRVGTGTGPGPGSGPGPGPGSGPGPGPGSGPGPGPASGLQPGTPDLVLVVADGLSAPAIERNALPMLAALDRHTPAHWRVGPVVIATQARVALGDEIGQAMGAALVAILIGERPGLSSPDSLGIYLTWQPRVGCSDAQRNCISNIRPEGLDYDAAAHRFWWLCREARQLGFSGVRLKDRSEEALLDGSSGRPLIAPQDGAA